MLLKTAFLVLWVLLVTATRDHSFQVLQTGNATQNRTSCETAQAALVEKCSGFQRLLELRALPTSSDLSTICPCFAPDPFRLLEVELFNASRNCDASFLISMALFSDFFCMQPSSRDKFCGEEFETANATMTLAEQFLHAPPLAAMNPRLLAQQDFVSVCTECFDIFLIGAYKAFGEIHAAATQLAPPCNASCRRVQAEAARNLVVLSTSAMLCIPNDNRAEVDNQGLAFCFPMVYNALQRTGLTCGTAASPQACSRMHGECASFDQACHRIVGVSMMLMPSVRLPPFSSIDVFCTNMCFHRVQSAMIDIAMTYEMLNVSKVNVSGAVTGRRDWVAITRGAETVAELSCVTNAGGRCLRQIGTIESTPGCQADTATFFSANPTCSATCRPAIQAFVNNVGCCYGVYSELQATTDARFQEFPNFRGIARACNVPVPPTCDALTSPPTSMEIIVTASCDWLKSAAANINVLINATARRLGVSPKSIRNFTVRLQNGSFCVANATALKHIRPHAQTLQAVLTSELLTATFFIIARDQTTANQIASSQQAIGNRPLVVPSTMRASSTTASVQKAIEVEKILAAARLPPTSAPNTSTPSPSVNTGEFGQAPTPVQTPNATNTSAFNRTDMPPPFTVITTPRPTPTPSAPVEPSRVPMTEGPTQTIISRSPATSVIVSAVFVAMSAIFAAL